MANPYFKFKQFVVYHDKTAMKVTTDTCLFGAWCADEISKEFADGKKALDIGSGNGLLSLMVGQKSRIEIDAVEIEGCAANQASENINRATFENSINIYHQDIKTFAPAGYDYIISNPPFYEHDLKSVAPLKNTAHHSSELNLEQLVEIISNKINSIGKFFLLLPFKRKDDITSLLKSGNLHLHKTVEVTQTENHKPFRIMMSGSKIPEAYKLSRIQIKSGEDYTTAFKELLQDYYFYL